MPTESDCYMVKMPGKEYSRQRIQHLRDLITKPLPQGAIVHLSEAVRIAVEEAIERREGSSD
jgi:hypothetical protein